MHLKSPIFKKMFFSRRCIHRLRAHNGWGRTVMRIQNPEFRIQNGKRSVGRCEEGLFAFEERWVRIVKAAVEGMGREVGEVFLVELAQGANEGAGFVHGPGGVGVGLVFVAAGRPKGGGGGTESG